MKAFWRLVVARTQRFTGDKEGKPRDLYVSPEGSESNPGTIERPLKTISRALELATDSMAIHPMEGRYPEKLVLEKPVMIRPLRRHVVILEGPIIVRTSWVDLVGLLFVNVEQPVRVEPGMRSVLLRQNKMVGCVGAAIHFAAPACPESFIIGNALEGRGPGPGILFECGEERQHTVIASNRLRGFEVGIQVVCLPGTLSPNVPDLWGNRVAGCRRAVALVSGATVTALTERSEESPPVRVQAVSGPRVLTVSPEGNDAGTGSPASPLATLGAAAGQAGPGDAIRLRGGEYSESGTFHVSGTATLPLTIESALGERAVFRRSHWVFQRSSHLIVRNITLADSPLTSVLLEEGCCHNLFEGVDIVDGAYGEHCFSLLIEGPGSQHNSFLGCRFVRSDAIRALGRGDTANISSGMDNYWNRFERCLFQGYLTAFHLGHGSYSISPSLYAVFAFNEFRQNSRDGIHIKTSDNLIYGNHFHHNWEGIGIRGAERNSIIGNTIERNDEVGLRGLGSDYLVWGNVIRDNGEAGIRLFHINSAHYSPAQGFRIYHNLLLRNGSAERPAAIVLEPHTSARIVSNVFVGVGGLLVEQDPMALILHADRNIYHQGQMPLLRECDGGILDAALDPQIDDADPKRPVVMNPGAREVLGWPDGRPPRHPALASGLGGHSGPWTPQYA
jgi:parallel beta-helix repeat protein